MDARQMEYFVSLAEEQQFTRAAALCGVSQSGLSAAIRSLEKELDAPLFARTTRRVEPTEAGHALLPHARAVLADFAAGRDAVVRTTRTESGQLRVGAEQCLGVVDAPILLERFRRRYPLVDIHFRQAGSHELVSQVRDGALDIAFVATTDHLSAVTTRPLGRRRVVLLAPQNHPLAAASSLAWADLRDAEFIDFRESWGVRSLNDATCATHGVARRVRCSVDDIHTLLDLIHRGLGVALVPQHVARKPQAAGLAEIQLPPGEAPEWVVSAITSARPGSSASLLLEIVEAERLVNGDVSEERTAPRA